MKKNGFRRFLQYLFILFIICFVAYVARIPIFHFLGNYLIKENAIQSKQVCFVLSGNAYDRGNKTIELYNKKYISHIYCTGGNISNDLKAAGILKKESELQKDFLVKNKIADSCITLLPEGTSSQEEILLINNYCLKNNIQNAIVLSGKFHTRRLYSIIKKSKTKINYTIVGSNSSLYNEYEWWKNEYGLIALNNEYIKLMYYKWKY
jgi:hypothetical protein